MPSMSSGTFLVNVTKSLYDLNIEEISMKLHYLQHVPFEGLANIENWARVRGFSITGTRLYAGANPPALDAVDWLVVMGGPMNIYEEGRYPWLKEEKKFIEKAIQSGKVVLGICLGAQLIADVLGGRVYRNPHKEIGWFNVSLTPEARASRLFSVLPDRFTAFHWHGDTFHLPPGAERTAESEACAVQAFQYDGGRVTGLQFHLESSGESIRLLISHCRDELTAGAYIQDEGTILSRPQHILEISRNMNLFLDRLKEAFPACSAEVSSAR